MSCTGNWTRTRSPIPVLTVPNGLRWLRPMRYSTTMPRPALRVRRAYSFQEDQFWAKPFASSSCMSKEVTSLVMYFEPVRALSPWGRLLPKLWWELKEYLAHVCLPIHMSHVSKKLETVVSVCTHDITLCANYRYNIQLCDCVFCWQRPSVMFINEAYFFNNGSCFVYDYHRYGTLLVSDGCC